MRKFLLRIFAFTYVLSFFSCLNGDSELWDLEENIHECILETRQIEIAGYPYAFNPSIIRWNGGILMTFRHIPDAKKPYHSLIGIIFLDDDFNPISEAQILDTQWEDSFPACTVPSRAEDARLIELGDRLYLVYSDNKNVELTGAGFRMYIAELHYEAGRFVVRNNECLTNYPDINPKRREKNWVPFVFEDRLHLAYSLQPHSIFKPIFGTGTCERAGWSEGNIHWNWGELRGSTQAFLVDGEYLSFFHSVVWMPSLQTKGKPVAHYFMGAYTFNPKPPFEITKISPYPILGKGFYTGKEYPRYWGSIRAIFPCGYIFDDNFVWVSYGKQDHEIWITKLDKHALYRSLVPVTNTVDGPVAPFRR